MKNCARKGCQKLSPFSRYVIFTFGNVCFLKLQNTAFDIWAMGEHYYNHITWPMIVAHKISD